jgi:hypothetical protein
MKRDVEEVLEMARQVGWKVERRRKHWQLTPPNDGPIISCPCSPSDYRALRNVAARVRRISVIGSLFAL